MSSTIPSTLVWLRRDLRLSDQPAFAHAVRSGKPIYVAFVFDTDILTGLAVEDRRLAFIHAALSALDARLRAWKSGVFALHGVARTELPRLARQLGADEVFAARDDEPTSIARDQAVSDALTKDGASLKLVSDHTLHLPGTILTAAGQPYTVFTPFKRKFLASVSDRDFVSAGPDEQELQASLGTTRQVPALPSLAGLGFAAGDLDRLGIDASEAGATRVLTDFADRIGRYDKQRDYPGVKGVSYLSVHLRFGTVSVRQAAQLAWETIAHQPGAAAGASTWLSELIWRDFYFQILHHFPHVVSRAFKPAYDQIRWADAPELFDAWCNGQTGYPLIDAAMAQINQTGYMHNRLRMVVASFLTKDLGIDWRRGEAYFAEKLIDFDLAANNGGWQWAASSGCDAQPWFRIFNPVTQSERFDPQGRFIRRYLPALAALSDKSLHAPWRAKPAELASANFQPGKHYPEPIVDHAQARQDTLLRYAVVKKAADT